MAFSSTLPSRKPQDRADADLTRGRVPTNPRDALGKAERFAELSEQAPDDGFESVIHGAYFAMFHAARAALLAVQGAASTKHGQVAASFARMSAKQDLRETASVLAKARDLHARRIMALGI